MTEPQPLQQLDRTYVRHQGRKLSYFAGCDYFRLASHPKVLQATRDGLGQFGLNVSASRMTTGNHVLYRELEKALAKFFGAGDALLLASGYLTNLAVTQALAGTFTHAFIDERAHAALHDAAALLQCPVTKFAHRNTDALATLLRGISRTARPLVLTDGMFSHDGSTAPLKRYLKALPANGIILVDDAHGAGVLGKNGRGTLELECVDRKRVVQCITLSKAFGVYGGAVLGSPALREKILSCSRSFTGSTPLPLPLANAALQSVKLLQANRAARARLFANADGVKTKLRKAGVVIPETPGPIIAICPTSIAQASALKRRLLAAGIFPPLIKYPGGPENGYFRFVFSSEHTRAQLDALAAALTA